MRLLICAVLAALVLTGCSSGDDDPEADIAPTADPSPTELFEPAPAEPSQSEEPFAPNLGDTALTVGEMRDGRDVNTTLLDVKFPLPPESEFSAPEPGQSYMGLRINQCLSEDYDGEPAYSSHPDEWSAVTRSGVEYSGGTLSDQDWPAPKFPELVEMIPGRCLKGWIVLQVPAKLRFQSLLWRPGRASAAAEWIPRG